MAHILDLTKTLDEHLQIFTSGPYSDPPLEIETWCTVQEQGYKVSRLSMGTQTGTHIDAPSHFVPAGANLEALPLSMLMGRYLWVDVCHVAPADLARYRSAYAGETILFLTASDGATNETSDPVLSALLELPCAVWVCVYGLQITGHDPYYFHRALAEAGKYLVEDVDEVTASRVNPGGQITALPLRLSGVSGSPCRVVVVEEGKRES